MDINNTNKYDEKMAERKELWIEIQKLDKKFENNKLKRCLCSIAFYAVVYTGIICKLFLDEIDLGGIVEIVVVSVFLAGISFWINAVLFSQLINKGNAETAMLEKMEKRLSEIDDELDELRKEHQLLK